MAASSISTPWAPSSTRASPSETLTAKPANRDAYRDQKIYDRGHLAPLAAFKGSRFASQVNYYSNIVPQRPNLNRGPWEELETRTRHLVQQYGRAWVMSGPIYEVNMPPLPVTDQNALESVKPLPWVHEWLG